MYMYTSCTMCVYICMYYCAYIGRACMLCHQQCGGRWGRRCVVIRVARPSRRSHFSAFPARIHCAAQLLMRIPLSVRCSFSLLIYTNLMTHHTQLQTTTYTSSCIEIEKTHQCSFLNIVPAALFRSLTFPRVIESIWDHKQLKNWWNTHRASRNGVGL